MNTSPSSATPRYGLILAIYVCGLMIGGLYVGMVSPVRTVIQEYFQISDASGIWMINIYTLFYAALIPIVGKLADRNGRKTVFLICLGIFAAGSLVCGLSQAAHFYLLLLAGRIIAAVGACGMIPVANAEIGATFPSQKRGIALGITAGVAGISNVIGAAVGSGVLALVGNGNWAWLFYLAIPLCLILALTGIKLLPSSSTSAQGSMDISGSVLFVLLIMLVLLGLRSADLLHPLANLSRPEVMVYLTIALVVLLAFVLVERKAADPVFHQEFLTNKDLVITMVVSFFVGCVIISMTMIPQICEVSLGLRTGSGGYFVIAVGALSLIGPPMGGKLIDKMGAKPVMLFGLVVCTAAYLMLALVCLPSHSPVILVVGLALLGLGMGFAMGAPTNYMVLEHTAPEKSGSAIATITLVRQIGTSLAPAIYVGFLTDPTHIGGFQALLETTAVFCVVASACMLAYKPASHKVNRNQ